MGERMRRQEGCLGRNQVRELQRGGRGEAPEEMGRGITINPSAKEKTNFLRLRGPSKENLRELSWTGKGTMGLTSQKASLRFPSM